ncbi:hypothetical protein SAMN05661080_00051 [Modestobacter sp. DSM 44400]|uniref:alpha/beta fold hydrolase n=1 Tax=Modestobacter sp. DSM 44400 TaxID=1550230 RepID=UPI00089A9B9F|nr:hypothetical protein [Modestobacter sp. DSM 44400]SDX47366.1 hypothetical protein SAMN05661080_00051 [Modestobacter sp. DSM 44400]
MAEDLQRVADARGAQRFDLAGYSMGAIVSLLVAAADARVRRLVVGGGWAAVVELGGVDTRTIRPEFLIAALEAADPATLADPAAASFRRLADGVGADRLAPAEVVAPTLVPAGDADPLAVRPEVLAAAIPGARLTLVSGDHLGAVAVAPFATALVELLGAP